MINDFQMQNPWLQSIITQDQFEKIDRWIYSFIHNTGKPDPLYNFNYCVLVKKPTSLNREVNFSPNCFPLLCEVQPEFLKINTKIISKPTLSEVHDSKQPLIYWFGNIHYFVDVFPLPSPKR